MEKETKKKTSPKKSASVKKVETKTKETKKKTKKQSWIKSVFKEVSKVKWPSKKEMIKYSVATIVFVIFFAGFFYLIELAMALLKSLV